MGHISDRADRFIQKLLKKPVEEQPEEPTQQQKVLQRIKRGRRKMLDRGKRM